MTYGRVYSANHRQKLDCAVVSHLAELVRGNFVLRDRKAPSSGRLAEGEPPARRPPSPVAMKARLRHDGEKGLAAHAGGDLRRDEMVATVPRAGARADPGWGR